MKCLFVLGVVIAGMVLGSCDHKTEYQYTEGKIYGTFYHISYDYPADLQTEIRQELERVNASLSMFNPNSVISRINRGECDSTDVLFRKLFQMGQKINQATDGAFDMTVGPLVNAWGFGYEKENFPDSGRIDSLLLLVGMDKLSLEGERLVKQVPGMELDASSIAKGFGVDLVAEYFDGKGIGNYMIEVGGEVRVKGESPKKRPWRIGIDRPEDDVMAADRQLQMVVGLTAGSLATSGNYRNFYVHDGKKYGHTINPKTGYPVQTEILGASVYAPTCMEADGYATAFMVMGLERAKVIIGQDSEVEGCLIYQEDGKLKTWISDGLRKKVISEAKN